MNPSTSKINWTQAQKRLREIYAHLTDEDFALEHVHEDALIDRLEKRTGEPRAYLLKLLRAYGDDSPGGTAPGPNVDAQTRGSGIPANTSHSGASGI